MIIQAIKALIVSAFIIFIPSTKPKIVDLRCIDETLVISISQSNPAFAALMDSQVELADLDTLESKEAISLQSGTLTVNLGNQENTKKIIFENAKIVSDDVIEISTFDVLPSIYNSQGELLPLSERKESLKKYFENSDSEELKITTWREKAKELIENADKTDITMQSEKLMASANNFQPIIIRKPENKNKKTKAAIVPKTNTKAKSNIASPEIATVDSYLKEFPQRNYIISGEIELAGGLAFAGQKSNLYVYRELDGEIVNSGTIWLDQGKYEIVVDDLRGYLIIELVDEKGETLGLSEHDLYVWENLPYENNKIEGVHVELFPLNKGLQFELQSSRSYKNHKIYIDKAGVAVDELGRSVSETSKNLFQDKFFTEDSFVWLRSNKKKYWSTLAPIQGYGLSQIQMFPEAHLQALAADLNVDLNNQKGWVFGKISGESGPLADASVEVVGISDNYKTYYFSLISELVFWPDKKAEKTTANGMFVVPDLAPGTYAIRIKIGENYLPSEIFKVESQNITYLDLSYKKMRTASVNVFDKAYGVNNLSAHIHSYGSENDLYVNGGSKDILRYPSGNGTMTFEVDAGSDYLLSKVQVPRNIRALRVPVISKKWMGQLMTETGIGMEYSSGMTIGYVNGDDFDVLLSEKLDPDEIKIIYFDEKGQLSDKGHGTKGGGFIISQLPEGLMSLAIIPHNKKTIIMKTLTVEAGYANSFETSF
ncbi:MAG: carboxypeptidase regulatory-like domain-containing protein [Bdellovibrionaceae bacterium]|nr:carboxypeptidase regulatory-like domain-containing protein [Pseudobdellovibrionaceae bacterium]